MSEERERIRVVIADDHPVVRMGVRLMLEMGEGIDLVGEAADGDDVLRQVKELQPDVVLLDLRMPPGMDGLEVVKQIHTTWPHIAVVMLTTYNEDDLMINCLRAGARGYLLKDADIDAVLHTIRAAARGEVLLQAEMMERILSRAARMLPPPRLQRSFQLTSREQSILAAVARGERSKEIARHFGITERTVSASLTTIYTKLGVDSRAAAVAVAIEQGLLPEQR